MGVCIVYTQYSNNNIKKYQMIISEGGGYLFVCKSVQGGKSPLRILSIMTRLSNCWIGHKLPN